MNVLITGCSSGIGFAACQALAKDPGVRLIIICRTDSSVQETLNKLGSPTAVGLPCDFSSLEDTLRCADRVRAISPTIERVVLCAGVMAVRDLYVNDIDVQLLINFLAPLLLASRVSPRVLLWISSCAHHLARSQDLVDINSSPDFYSFFDRMINTNGWVLYARSKLLDLYAARRIAFFNPHVLCYAIHPGIVDTKLGRHTNWLFKVLQKFTLSPEIGAATIVHCCKTDINDLKNEFPNGSYLGPVNKLFSISDLAQNDEIADDCLNQSINLISKILNDDKVALDIKKAFNFK